MDRAQKRLVYSIYDLGVRGAVTVPVHMPAGQAGAVSWFSYDHLDLKELLHRNYAHLLTASSLIIAHARRLYYTPKAGDERYARLTIREIECLNYVASGMTDQDIADALSLSYPTIRFHIDNAGRKLRTKTRAQTAALAAQLGLLKSCI
jgi:DNA-binding CsgD family transcriptional regulator